MASPENGRRPAVLLVGNFLSASTGTRGVCEDLAAALKIAGWPVLSTSSRLNRFARLIDFLLTVLLKRNNYNVAQVDVYSGPAFLWAEVVCWALKTVQKPYILTLHGGNLPVFASRSGKRVQRLLRSSSAVTTPSTYLHQEMRHYRQDLVLIPNPLDLAKYQFRRREQPAPNLIWLRAFHDIYNPALAVRVLALLVQDFPSVRLFMIGPDKRDGSCEATKDLAVKLGVAERVQFTGAVPKDETPHWLQQGDIFLNTTRVDNTPVSVLEAMACGLCIVSTNVGGVPYLIEHDVEALLVPPDDALSMANAIRRILDQKGLAERLCRNARQKVEQVDLKEIIPKWEGLLTSVSRKSLNG
jgi:glycosyltransferase involved in cell wall biosynthesis